MDVTLRQLRVFVAVADTRSFTRAGETLGLPQSTMSTQLSELERALGLRLFDRHTRMLRLTEAGGEILPLARKTYIIPTQIQYIERNIGKRRVTATPTTA